MRSISGSTDDGVVLEEGPGDARDRVGERVDISAVDRRSPAPLLDGEIESTFGGETTPAGAGVAVNIPVAGS